MPGITNIREVADLGTSAARINRETGELFINKRMFANMDADQKLFIMLHEAGHAELDTQNEFEADRYAFTEFVKLGKPLSQAVKALSRNLSFQGDKAPEQRQRLKTMVRMALDYDYRVNHNEKANLMKFSNLDGADSPGAGSTGGGTDLSAIIQSATSLLGSSGTGSTGTSIPAVTPEQQAMGTVMSMAGIDQAQIQKETIDKIKKNPLNGMAPIMAISTITSIFKGKKSTWEKMKEKEKEDFVEKMLTIVFEGANEQFSPKDLCVEALKQIGENFDRWWKTSTSWVPGRVKDKENKYNKKWEEKSQAIMNRLTPEQQAQLFNKTWQETAALVKAGTIKVNPEAWTSRPGSNTYVPYDSKTVYGVKDGEIKPLGYQVFNAPITPQYLYLSIFFAVVALLGSMYFIGSRLKK